MDLQNSWKWSSNYDLTNYTLVVPSVAVGNVAQLACDLLIATLRMEKLASIYTTAQVPIVGCDPYNLASNTLSTACELYVSAIHNLLVLQVRSPLIQKRARSFLENLVDQFQQKQIKDIIILSSSFAHEKKHIMTSPFRFIASNNTPYSEQIQMANLIPHEQPESDIKIFGGGYAAMLFNICKEKSLPCLCVYKYCSEGDNVPDAYDMVEQLQNIFPLLDRDQNPTTQFIQPASWKLLFGRPPPQEIY
ncbi:proteasome assembly chaperone 2 [Pieris napi]|uniref:proteasome assembly chaperone 2 n=1 Tax=Pieris napi TaxID=78633 RepID=UPI001FBB13D7|nr:proteasome assembly chaperone 2 [Pieris napi]XP_047508275.1 proteasome assembly chaperone 2 [Pieris napi]XP_047508276.1 proteasome assembly chaperone 2 [Pieris napi]